MKLMHISDLHIGRRLGEMPLTEDQEHILEEILSIAETEQPQAVLIAGDIYDKSAPSAEAVRVFDNFLVGLANTVPAVIAVSGNHDSAERLAFGNRLMSKSGVHFTSVFDGALQMVELEDEAGPVCVWMLPFIKPVHVRRFDESIDRDDYTAAVRSVIESARIDPAKRNILVAHQYVTGSQRSESEERSIGGLDNVDSSVFAPFDYVALGHLHRAQTAGGEHIRYSGAPLAYSFGEAGDEKCVLMIELGEKPSEEEPGAASVGSRCRLTVRDLPLHPLRKMRVLRGSFDELMTQSFYEGTDYRDAFVKAVLTDEDFIPDGIRRLRTVYRNILEVTYENIVSSDGQTMDGPGFEEEKQPAEYLEDFYRIMRGRELSEDQKALADELIRTIWEEER